MAYRPIADYGLIGDCRTAALVSKDGSVDWLCLPHFSGCPIFAAILDDQKGGRLQVSGKNVKCIRRHYRERTAVIVTEFECDSGSFRLTDCLITGTEIDLEPQRELLRRVEIRRGTPEIEVHFQPFSGNSGRTAKFRQASASCWTFSNRGARLMLCSDIELNCSGAALTGSFRGTAGEVYFLSFSYTERDMAVIPPLSSAEHRGAAPKKTGGHLPINAPMSDPTVPKSFEAP